MAIDVKALADMIRSGNDFEERLQAILLEKVPGLDAECLSLDPVPAKVIRS